MRIPFPRWLLKFCLALVTPRRIRLRRTTVSFESGIVELHSAAKSLDALIVAFPNSGGTILQALGIHEAAIKVHDAARSAHKAAKASSALKELEGSAMLDLLKAFIPDVQQTGTDIISKKAALKGLPLPGISAIVLQDMEMLKQDSDMLVAAFLAKMPASLAGETEALVRIADAAINQVITFYSS